MSSEKFLGDADAGLTLGKAGQNAQEVEVMRRRGLEWLVQCASVQCRGDGGGGGKMEPGPAEESGGRCVGASLLPSSCFPLVGSLFPSRRWSLFFIFIFLILIFCVATRYF